MGRTLVIGASGFLGRPLAEELVRNNQYVVAMARSLPSDLQALVGKAIEGDFRDEETLSHALNGVDSIVVVTKSSSPAEQNFRSTSDYANDLEALDKLARLALRRDVRKLVYISSGGAVYGNQAQLPISESFRENPISDYGKSKLEIEKHLQNTFAGTEVNLSILRVSNPYGPGQRSGKPQGVIPNLFAAALKNEVIHIYGNTIRDYIYIDDTVKGIACSLQHFGSEEIINIGSGKGVSLSYLVELIEDITGAKIRTAIHSKRLADVGSNVLDISRARECLSWFPAVDLKTGLQLTALAFDIG